MYISFPHNWLHTLVKCDMLDLRTGGYHRPVFYLHHAYMDRQFAFWQQLQRLWGKGLSQARLVRFPDSDWPLASFVHWMGKPYEIQRCI